MRPVLNWVGNQACPREEGPCRAKKNGKRNGAGMDPKKEGPKTSGWERKKGRIGLKENQPKELKMP